MPIRGLDRKGVYVVERWQPAGENDKTIGVLSSHSQVKYAAPLFSCEGDTVALIPEIVTCLKEGASQQDLAAACESAGCRIKKRMEFTTQEYLLEVLGPDADAVFFVVKQLNDISFVQWACPNTALRLRLAGQTVSAGDRVHAQDSVQAAGGASATSGIFPNDEYFPIQWHLHNTGQSGGTPGADIRAPEAWEITTGDPNIIIAVVDSGVDTNHPDLMNNLVPGYDFYDDDDLPDPARDDLFDAHGTACAGLVAAEGDNLIGVTGVARNCKIMPIRTMDPDAHGISNETQADVAAALRWAASRGADILSNSWSWGRTSAPIINSAIVDITKGGGMGREGKGCVVLFCAMNSGRPVGDYYPGCYTEVIAVGATHHDDTRHDYSNFGPELDIVAPSGPKLPGTPGVWVWTTDVTADAGFMADVQVVLGMLYEFFGFVKDESDLSILDYTPFGGTSASTPIAAGVAALILSIEPNLTNEEVRHFLEQSAKDLGEPGKDDYYGCGRVDARAALDMVLAKRADLNDDWKVNWQDFAVLAECWRTSGPEGDIGPAPKPDGFVDVHDVILMGRYWLEEIPEIAQDQ